MSFTEVKGFLIKCSTSWPYLISEFLVAYICVGLALFSGCFCLVSVFHHKKQLDRSAYGARFIAILVEQVLPLSLRGGR